MSEVNFKQTELSQLTAIATACDAQISEMGRWKIANPTQDYCDDDKAFLAVMTAYKILYDRAVVPFIMEKIKEEEEKEDNGNS